MQTLARRPATRGVQFAAVAVSTGHAAASKAVRAHRWTIPVAYDPDGARRRPVRRHGLPDGRARLSWRDRGERLIGEHWLSAAALAAQVQALLRRAERGR